MKAMLEVCTPTSISYSGTSASITGDGGVEFTACSSLSLNGVFSANYDNYQVVLRGKTPGGAGGLQWFMRLRSSGTDNSTASSYTYQYIYAGATTITANRYTSDKATLWGVYDANELGFTTYYFGPYLSQPTAGRPVGVNSQSGAGIYEFAFTHNQSTSYDGFTLTTAATSMTGLLTVFGFTQ